MNPEKKATEEHDEYTRRTSFGRKLKAYWSVQGPQFVLIGLVIGLQIDLGTWQLVKYLTGPYTHVRSLPIRVLFLLIISRLSDGV